MALIKQQIRKSKESMIEIATPDRDLDRLVFGNYFPNPDPVLETEAGGKGVKLYDEVARDGHTASVLQTRYLAVVGKEWSVVPAETAKNIGRNPKESKEQKIASFVESVLMGCNFDQMRMELLQAILYGYYGSEIIWKLTDDGGIGIDVFRGKHPRRMCFDVQREPRLITPENMIEGEPLPDKKFLVFQYGDSDNPYGSGLGQKLWWYVWFKKHGIKFWVVFMEKFGMPTPLGKYPPQMKDQKSLLVSAMKAIQKENCIAIPEGMDIQLMEAARQGDGSYKAACEYFDAAISKIVLGQTLTTEVGNTGSYAASQTHNSVRQDIIEADADLLDAYLNKTLIPWIVDYNFPGVMAYPQFVTYASQKPDLISRSAIDKTLSVDVGLPITKAYFYETYGIPEPQEGEEVVEREQMSGLFPGMDGQGQGGEPPDFAEGKSKESPEQRSLDNLGDAALKKYKQVSVGIESQLRKMAEKYSTLEEFRDAIYSEYSHMDMKELQELIFETLVTGGIYGRSVAQGEIEAADKKYAGRVDTSPNKFRGFLAKDL